MHAEGLETAGRSSLLSMHVCCCLGISSSSKFRSLHDASYLLSKLVDDDVVPKV